MPDTREELGQELYNVLYNTTMRHFLLPEEYREHEPQKFLYIEHVRDACSRGEAWLQYAHFRVLMRQYNDEYERWRHDRYRDSCRARGLDYLVGLNWVVWDREHPRRALDVVDVRRAITWSARNDSAMASFRQTRDASRLSTEDGAARRWLRAGFDGRDEERARAGQAPADEAEDKDEQDAKGA